MAARKTYILKLYVAGNTPNSMRALNTLKEILENEDHSATIQEMKEELINDLILESIPPKSYINDWDHEKLSMKCSEVFGLNLPIKAWMNEEGVDEEEIKKRIIDQTDQKYAERADWTTFTGDRYFPGEPARIFAGFTWKYR